jgi:hypothetical protein
MAFESKRLRVQLPCKKAGTLVEKEAEPEAARMRNPECMIFGSRRFRPPINCGFPSPQGCVFCTWVSPECQLNSACEGGFQTPNCIDSFLVPRHCLAGTQDCGGPTVDPGTEPIVVDPDPENPDTVLLRPEDLGRFRRQLEAELERIEALEQRRGEIEGQLKEVDSAEKALKKRSKRK